MTDRNALAREMLEAWKIDRGLPNEKAADIALRHIKAARAEALEEAALMEVRDQYWTVGPIAEIAIAALEPPGDG
jgi:hypothetical protein